jgi:hypothetical protein
VTGNFSAIQWFAPIGLILGGLLIGLFVDRIALGRLRKLVARTKWNGDEIVIGALCGMPLLWSTKRSTFPSRPEPFTSNIWKA